jgi:hypothetical protein
MISSMCENLVEKCEAAIIRNCVQSGDFGKGPPPFKSDVASTNYLIRWTMLHGRPCIGSLALWQRRGAHYALTIAHKWLCCVCVKLLACYPTMEQGIADEYENPEYM